MTNRLHVEGQILRLSAAFPTYRMAGPTQELYVQKLLNLDMNDFGNAVEHFIEHGLRFPSIGHLRDKAHDFESLRGKRAALRADEERGRERRMVRADFAGAAMKFSDAENVSRFEDGRANALEHLRLVMSGDGTGSCRCLGCQRDREERAAWAVATEPHVEVM